MEINTIGNTTQQDTIHYLQNKLINNKADCTSLNIAQNYKPKRLIYI
jgi:hypothetical protein